MKIETSQISKQGLYEVLQKFKDSVRNQGKAFYRIHLEIDSDAPVPSQDILQVEEMIREYEENQTQFIYVEDLIVTYKDDESRPIAQEFSSELKDDNKVFEHAMNDLYLNPKASNILITIMNLIRLN